jgi:hypothetical protein
VTNMDVSQEDVKTDSEVKCSFYSVLLSMEVTEVCIYCNRYEDLWK